MTHHIRIRDKETGRIGVINYQADADALGDEWVKIEEHQIPEITESGVAVKHYYDAEAGEITAETEPTPDDDLI